jgi:hypothetical protein
MQVERVRNGISGVATTAGHHRESGCFQGTVSTTKARKQAHHFPLCVHRPNGCASG